METITKISESDCGFLIETTNRCIQIIQPVLPKINLVGKNLKDIIIHKTPNNCILVYLITDDGTFQLIVYGITI